MKSFLMRNLLSVGVAATLSWAAVATANPPENVMGPAGAKALAKAACLQLQGVPAGWTIMDESAGEAAFDAQTKDATAAVNPAWAPRTHLSEVKDPDKGGISCANYYKVKAGTVLHRMHAAPNSGLAGQDGVYWAAQNKDQADAASYRVKYAICTTWNDLSMRSTCTLTKDVVLQVGPGQSVGGETCLNKDKTKGQGEKYPANPAIQVVLPMPAQFCTLAVVK